MSVINGTEQPYTYHQNSAFEFLSHIPDENPNHEISNADFIRGNKSWQLHAPIVNDKHLDYEPQISIREDFEKDRTRFHVDQLNTTRINMTGQILDKYVTSKPTQRQVIQNMDDTIKPLPNYNHMLYTLDDKGQGETAIMLTGAREVPMSIRFGGPTTQTRGQHRLEKSTMRVSKHKDSLMAFRPHNELVVSNEMHHMVGQMEYATTAHEHLEQDMLLAFHPRNQTDIYNTYFKDEQILDTDLVVVEPDGWI